MPDLKNFTITPLANASMSVPRFTLSGQVVSSDATQTVLADFTGANAVNFPAVLGTLTAAERLEFVEMIAHWMLRKKGLL